MKRLALVWVVLAGCAVGAPLGFSKGEHWSFPVVNGLDDGTMLTPVMINGKGPYLFALLPRSYSIIDPRVVRELDLYVKQSRTRLINSSDTISAEKTEFAELDRLQLGDLTVESQNFLIRPMEMTYSGRPVMGILGRDVFAESVIWTFDRDLELVSLAVQGKAAVSADARPIRARTTKDGRFFVDAKIDGKAVSLWIDLMQGGSSLWPKVAEQAGLSRGDHGWVVEKLTVGDTDLGPEMFFEHRDERDRTDELDGRIGNNLLTRFRLTVNWHQGTMWVTPRDGDLVAHADERVLRWGGAMKTCAVRACVGVAISREEGKVVVSREESARQSGYEVSLLAIDDSGKPLPIPRVRVSFPPGVAEVTIDEGPYARAADLVVVDMSPFHAACDDKTGCFATE
jgi:hypothetical protein